MSVSLTLPKTTDDLLQLAWLCEMAAIGCIHTNRSAWASQLRLDAAGLRAQADAARERG